MDNASRAQTRRRIRPFHDADEAEVVGVWHRSGLAAYPYLPTWQALTMERAQFIFTTSFERNAQSGLAPSTPRSSPISP